MNGWSRYDIGNANEATREELQKAVRAAGKTANQRLLRLERAGKTGGVYKTAQGDLGQNRTRFKTRTANMTIGQLRHEYKILRSFLSAKSSTLSGRAEIDRKRYETAVAKGFEGTQDEFYDQVEDYYSETVEQRFSSDTIYIAITSGTVDVLEKIIERTKSQETIDRGALLQRYLRAYKGQQIAKKKKKN